MWWRDEQQRNRHGSDAMRVYVTDVIGPDGPGTITNPHRSAVYDHGVGVLVSADGRADKTTNGPSMIVQCDPTPVQHAAMLSDTRIDYIGEI